MNTRMRTGGQKSAKFHVGWNKYAWLSFPFYLFCLFPFPTPIPKHISSYAFSDTHTHTYSMIHEIKLNCFYLIKIQRHIRMHQNYLIISTKKNHHNFHLEHTHICTIYPTCTLFLLLLPKIFTATFRKLVQQSKHTVSCTKIHGKLESQTSSTKLKQIKQIIEFKTVKCIIHVFKRD